MLRFIIRMHLLLGEAGNGFLAMLHRRRVSREEGQTTAEYALVILAAAAVAIVLITWARSSGKLPAFFDKIIDNITNDAQ